MLPPSAIKYLRDYGGDYLIFVRCRGCRHVREIEPVSLARRVGWEAELAQVTSRLKCSQCGKRTVDVAIGFERKPRGWKKNPS